MKLAFAECFAGSRVVCHKCSKQVTVSLVVEHAKICDGPGHTGGGDGDHGGGGGHGSSSHHGGSSADHSDPPPPKKKFAERGTRAAAAATSSAATTAPSSVIVEVEMSDHANMQAPLTPGVTSASMHDTRYSHWYARCILLCFGCCVLVE